MYIWVGPRSCLYRGLEGGRHMGMKCEVEGNSGEDELDVVTVAKPGTEEARAKTTQTITPLCDRLGEC